ncbi:MAG: metal-dependent hydrolase, partial [Actinobacteria bacterium]|nr:metal-dependent hydrolase [Actinomycetota bacterium]
MILWHMGTAAVIVYVTLGRARIDYRWILVGAILPDVVDGILNLTLYEGPSGRGAAHSILAVVVVAVAVLLVTKGATRLSVFGLAVGWLLHLVADGMWLAPETFLWPAFGGSFSASPVEPYGWDLLAHPGAHLGTWVGEIVGLAALLYLAAAFELGDPDRRRRFLHDGLLRA